MKTNGAFYFLVPVPNGIDEKTAVDILAKEYSILLMPGTPFGAPGYMRLSYGSLPPATAMASIDNLKKGLSKLKNMINDSNK